MNQLTLDTCLPANVDVIGPMAENLLQEFCKCPAAAELLSDVSRLFKSISIEVGQYLVSYSQQNEFYLLNPGEITDPEKAKKQQQKFADEQTLNMFIDQKEQLKDSAEGTHSSLKSLVSQLHIGLQKEKHNDLQIRAHIGNISSDDYAIGSEYTNWKSANGAFETQVKCQKIWNTHADAKVLPDFNDHMLGQEILGVADFIRREWYGCCKDTYCSKHSDDVETCKKTADDFIDFSAERQKPKAVIDAIYLDRFAKNFHKASKQLQSKLLEVYGTKLTRKLELLAKKQTKASGFKDDL